MVVFNNKKQVDDVEGGNEATKSRKKVARPTLEVTMVNSVPAAAADTSVDVGTATEEEPLNPDGNAAGAAPAVVADEREDVATTTSDRDDELTPLFLAIQGCDWKGAMLILSEERGQRQVRVWATSRTEDCVGVPTWRRLPIHEACRRQAPAYIVEALLKADPRSAQLKTHFSELPIHIACGFGASEEVVSILLTAFPDGIIEVDEAKRSPIDCYLMARRPRDSITFRSMERCFAFISERTKALEKATAQTTAEHAAEVANLESTLQEQGKQTMQEISSLQNIISEKKLSVEHLESLLRSCQETLELKLQVEAALTETVAHLENTNEEARVKISNCISNIKMLNSEIVEKDGQIMFLTDKVKKTEAKMITLMDFQTKLESHAAKRKVYAKKEEQEWKNMLTMMENQRKTAEVAFEQLLSM
jgi:hypothetical protein